MDVTQEKKAEIESRQALKEAYRSAENANRAKTEFLSNMSHDIRTPMNAIVGLTAIAGANVESQDRVIECLGKITESSRHLLGLINEVLDMARIESGKMTLAQEDFNLSELVDNLITLTKPVLDEHKHNFDIHINHIEHEAVCGDSLRIHGGDCSYLWGFRSFAGFDVFHEIRSGDAGLPDYPGIGNCRVDR